MPITPGWRAPRSPHGLIQEDFLDDEWMVLVLCVCLNCTTRKQVEKVLPAFRAQFPTAVDLVVDTIDDRAKDELVTLVSPLGFGNRRAVTLIKLSRDFLRPGWTDARALHGIGEYGGRAHDMFCRGVFGDVPPKDHALVEYWRWAKEQEL